MSESVPIEQPGGLSAGDFTEADEPLRLFAAWFEEATRTEPRDPTAMSLATVDAEGLPNVRMVLMKGFDERGWVFFTNVDSQKGLELDRTHKAALLFHWKSLNRQVRLRGPVERIDDAAADAYFATRPRSSSGRTGRSDCTIASSSGAPRRARRGTRRDFIPDVAVHRYSRRNLGTQHSWRRRIRTSRAGPCCSPERAAV